MSEIPMPSRRAPGIQRSGVMVRFECDDAPDYRGWVRHALQLGSFHVHRTVTGNRLAQDVGDTKPGFTLTHTLSGVAVARSIPTLDAACGLAAYMEAAPVAWHLSDYRAIRRNAGPRLRKLMRARIAMSGGRP